MDSDTPGHPLGPTDADAILALMARHRSVRTFTDRPVTDAEIERAVTAAQCASTSSWIQGYHLLQVEKGPRREQLSVLSGHQAQVREAPAFFVICGDTRRHRMAAARNDFPHVECTETFLLAVVDATLFAQNLMLAFEAQGFGGCFIGGLRNDLPAVDELLAVPSGTMPLFGFTVGEPTEDAGTRPRFQPSDVWTKEHFPTDAELEATIEEFDHVAASYYTERDAEGRNWSGGVSRKFKAPLRPGLKAYFESKGASLS